MSVSTATFGITANSGSQSIRTAGSDDVTRVINIGSIPLQYKIIDQKVSDMCKLEMLSITSTRPAQSVTSPSTVKIFPGKDDSFHIDFNDSFINDTALTCTLKFTIVAWQINIPSPKKGFIDKKEVTVIVTYIPKVTTSEIPETKDELLNQLSEDMVMPITSGSISPLTPETTPETNIDKDVKIQEKVEDNTIALPNTADDPLPEPNDTGISTPTPPLQEVNEQEASEPEPEPQTYVGDVTTETHQNIQVQADTEDSLPATSIVPD